MLYSKFMSETGSEGGFLGKMKGIIGVGRNKAENSKPVDRKPPLEVAVKGGSVVDTSELGPQTRFVFHKTGSLLVGRLDPKHGVVPSPDLANLTVSHPVDTERLGELPMELLSREAFRIDFAMGQVSVVNIGLGDVYVRTSNEPGKGYEMVMESERKYDKRKKAQAEKGISVPEYDPRTGRLGGKVSTSLIIETPYRVNRRTGEGDIVRMELKGVSSGSEGGQTLGFGYEFVKGGYKEYLQRTKDRTAGVKYLDGIPDSKGEKI